MLLNQFSTQKWAPTIFGQRGSLRSVVSALGKGRIPTLNQITAGGLTCTRINRFSHPWILPSGHKVTVAVTLYYTTQ